MQHQGPSRFKTRPPISPRMSFNNQQQQHGIMPTWSVNPGENGFTQSYPPIAVDQAYQGPSPPAIYIPDYYLNHPQQAFNTSVEMHVAAQGTRPLTKETVGRASITLCSQCKCHNYLCESELAKCDSKIAHLSKENESLRFQNEQLVEQLKQLQSTIKGKGTVLENIDIKTAAVSHKGLSPDAMEFSPKRQEEVPVVSIKDVTEDTQDDLAYHQVLDEDKPTCETDIVPRANTVTTDKLPNEMESATNKVPEDDIWDENYTDFDLKKQPELNQKANEDNWSKSRQKRRGSDHGNGHDVNERQVKKHDKDYHQASSQVGHLKSNRDSHPRDQRGSKTTDWKKSGSSGKNYTDRKSSIRPNLNKQEDDYPEQRQNSREEERGGRMKDRPRQTNQDYNNQRGNYRDSKGAPSKAQSVKNIVKEIDGDLFNAPNEYSLGHCVAEDFRMGSGIAVRFKQEFKRTGELLDQNVTVGGCAFLKDRNAERYIFYLVTKRISSGKPTLESLHKSLVALHKKCQELGVTKLAIPRIGCGLDRLDWDSVKYKINIVFQGTEMDICVYNFNADGLPESEGKRPPGPTGPFVSNNIMKLQDIDRCTAILFFGTEDGYMDSTAISLNEKFNFVQEYKKANKIAGKVWLWDKNREYYIYSLIVSKTFLKNNISFLTIEKALREFSNMLKNHQWSYVGLECLKDWSDEDTFTEKMVTMLRHTLPWSVRELWVCYREEEDDKHNLCLRNPPKQSQY